jgi:hypothetical protein
MTSPGRTSACSTILFAVDVPFVTKNVSRAPNALAAMSCARLIGPRGCNSESSPPLVADVSARKMFGP